MSDGDLHVYPVFDLVEHDLDEWFVPWVLLLIVVGLALGWLGDATR